MVIAVWVVVVGLTCGEGLLWVVKHREGGLMPGWGQAGASPCHHYSRAGEREAGWVVCVPYVASGVYSSVLVVGSCIL